MGVHVFSPHACARVLRLRVCTCLPSACVHVYSVCVHVFSAVVHWPLRAGYGSHPGVGVPHLNSWRVDTLPGFQGITDLQFPLLHRVTPGFGAQSGPLSLGYEPAGSPLVGPSSGGDHTVAVDSLNDGVNGVVEQEVKVVFQSGCWSVSCVRGVTRGRRRLVARDWESCFDGFLVMCKIR